MDSNKPGSSGSEGDVHGLVEHLFRHESGKMVAILTRIFGLEHLTLAEDVVQEALARALQTWPFYGVPENPSAWLLRAARNLALDVVRRQKVFREKEPEIISLIEPSHSNNKADFFSEEEIADDRLRMIFVCCHPVIPVEAQLALALNTLCGFSVTEVSRAFLTSEAAMAKRLTRAKQKIREEGVAFEIPEGEELNRRLDAVLNTLYLLFNEGYKASVGDKLIREELCQEAIRLAHLLVQHPAGNQPRSHALLALMLLNSGRFPARMDSEGNLLRLQEQNREQWNRELIAQGLFHLAQSAAGDAVTRFHLEAGIAACHCAAPNYQSTDWPRILRMYDHLIAFDSSPVVALNRAVALANAHGPDEAIEAIDTMVGRGALESYYLYYAVLGDLEGRRGNAVKAMELFQRARELTNLASEQAFLDRRLREVSPRAETPGELCPSEIFLP